MHTNVKHKWNVRMSQTWTYGQMTTKLIRRETLYVKKKLIVTVVLDSRQNDS